jgi:DNA-directed RNA polymerase specialized sigma subunit
MGRRERLTIADVDSALRVAGGERDASVADGCRCGGKSSRGQAPVAARLLPLLSQLDARRQCVLNLRYGLNGESRHTLQAIGNKLSRTRERVRQIQNSALSRLLALAQAE